MSEWLFSYGTLQKEKTQLELFGRSMRGHKDILTGYKITTIEITDPSFLSKGEDKYQRTLTASGNIHDAIEGTVLELTPEELSLADRYEPENYKRSRVTLQSGKQAWIYLAGHSRTNNNG
jgi:gamma-glutamylcyclotransferase (GGCT)/AIG2-like uncharacterized protein YtfP